MHQGQGHWHNRILIDLSLFSKSCLNTSSWREIKIINYMKIIYSCKNETKRFPEPIGNWQNDIYNWPTNHGCWTIPNERSQKTKDSSKIFQGHRTSFLAQFFFPESTLIHTNIPVGQRIETRKCEFVANSALKSQSRVPFLSHSCMLDLWPLPLFLRFGLIKFCFYFFFPIRNWFRMQLIFMFIIRFF